ncbi:MAG TPA: cysteine dioxygenase family protein [Terriglobales bacterium]
MTTSVPARPVSIDDFVSELRKLDAAAFEETPQVLQLMQSFPVAPESLSQYLTWDRQHYTRNLIDKTALYELIAICWEVGQASSVHNHHDQNCWMSAPMGKLHVENFHLVVQDLNAGTCKLEAADTVEMSPACPCAVNPLDPVHRVYNPREFGRRAVSLHVYSRPFDECLVYSPEQGTCGEIKLHYNTEFGKVCG